MSQGEDVGPAAARTEVHRRPERARYDLPTAQAVFDHALICHVGIVRADGPLTIPFIHARRGDILYLHGSTAAGLMGHATSMPQWCVTATIVHGIVLTRSARGHALNYESAVVFGTARLVQDPHEKLAALQAVIERVAPGRWAEVRPPSRKDMAQTAVAAVTMEEVSVKARTGPPIENLADAALPGWAGEVPIHTVTGQPIPAAGAREITHAIAALRNPPWSALFR